MLRAARPKTKVIVRNLPYNLTEADFRVLIQEHLGGVDYLYYFPGKKGAVASSPSRAFIHFSDADKMYTFAEKYEGHKFVDGKGLSVTCSIELSPNQRWTDPNNRRDKPDKQMNTIDQDEQYLKFVEALKAPPVAPKEEPVVPQPNPNDFSKPMSTPILDDLRRKAAAKVKAQQEKSQKLKEKREKQRQKQQAKKAAAAGGATPAPAKMPQGPIRIAQKPQVAPAASTATEQPAVPAVTATAPAAAPAKQPNNKQGKNKQERGGKNKNRGGGGGQQQQKDKKQMHLQAKATAAAAATTAPAPAATTTTQSALNPNAQTFQPSMTPIYQNFLE